MSHDHLPRRRFIRTLGWLVVLGGPSLLAACQGQAPGGPTSAPAVTATAAPPKPAAPASPAAAPAASPSPSPAAAAASPSPAPVAGSAVAGHPMYQMDPQHTGRSPYDGPRRAVVARAFDTFSFPTQDPAIPRPDIQSAPAVGPDGTIYLGTFAGNLFALRDSGGDKLEVAWRFHPPGGTSLHATPAIGPDGNVYLGFGNGLREPQSKGTFYAFKAPASGLDPQIAWTVDLGPGRPTSSPIVAADGTIYTVGGEGRLFAIAPDGKVKWTVQAGPTLKGSPALGPDGTVYLPSMDGKLYAAAPPSSGGSEGSIRWTFDFGQHLGPTPLVTSQGGGGANGIGSGASPTIAPDGMIYVGANNSNFYAIAPDGSMNWLFEAERELAGIWTTAALAADASTLYFGANKGGIYALNRADGKLRWRYDVYGSIYASSALDRRGTLYTGTTVGHLYALDAADGALIWDYDDGAQIWSAPAIRPDGSLVIADRQGRVLVFGSG